MRWPGILRAPFNFNQLGENIMNKQIEMLTLERDVAQQSRDLWIKRWNTMKNALEDAISGVASADLDDSEIYALKRMKHIMSLIEEMEENEDEKI